jgi:hypothetical protein
MSCWEHTMINYGIKPIFRLECVGFILNLLEALYFVKQKLGFCFPYWLNWNHGQMSPNI